MFFASWINCFAHDPLGERPTARVVQERMGGFCAGSTGGYAYLVSSATGTVLTLYFLRLMWCNQIHVDHCDVVDSTYLRLLQEHNRQSSRPKGQSLWE